MIYYLRPFLCSAIIFTHLYATLFWYLYFYLRFSYHLNYDMIEVSRVLSLVYFLHYGPWWGFYTCHPFPVYGLIVDRACRSKPLRLNVRLKIGECSGPPEPARLLLLPIFCLSGEPWPHGCATTTRSRHVIGIHKAGEGRRVVVSEGDRRCRGRGCN